MGGGDFLEAREKKGEYMYIYPHPHPHTRTRTHTPTRPHPHAHTHTHTHTPHPSLLSAYAGRYITNLQSHFCGDALINLIDKMAQGPAPRSPSPCLRMRALSLTLEVVQYSAADALARTPTYMPLPCDEFAKPLLW